MFELEELARQTLEKANIGTPVDPDILASELDVVVMDGGPNCHGLHLHDSNRIWIDDSARSERRSFAVAHELAHLLLRRAGLPNTERNANYLASALLLPRDDFRRSMRRVGWELLLLKSEHRHASFEAIARRVVALRPRTRAWVFDKPLAGQPGRKRYCIPYGGRLTHEESEAARLAAGHGAPLELVAGVEAWPLLEASWLRVIVLADLDSLRLA